MSVQYRAISWNRQKRRYDAGMTAAMLAYLLVFAAMQVLLFPSITPETLIIRATGSLAFVMLHVILSIGPLARLDPRLLPLLYNRRHAGVAMSLLALTHGLFSIVQFHALGDKDPLVSLFTTGGGADAWIDFQPLGFVALVIIALMAATSHDFWLKNLDPGVWKALHMSVYAAYALLVLHVSLGLLQSEQSPWLAGLVGLGLLWVAGLHVAVAWKQRGVVSAPPAARDAFVEVCPVEAIAEGRARIVTVGTEDIAIFRYEGRLSAVSNACKHQHGPLGEGRIIDGCITCPWHGYQYLPHNGRSPEPFTEKLKTYDVQIRQGVVWVRPVPYAEGTARPPAQIV
ncbi:MAG: hypothetical protein OHK0039_20680 [Bacteroidia bacterium]